MVVSLAATQASQKPLNPYNTKLSHSGLVRKAPLGKLRIEKICEVHSFLGVIAFLQQCNSMLLRDRRPPNPGFPAIVKNSNMARSFYLRLGFSHLHLLLM